MPQIFNMLNSRKIKDELNVFSGIFSSHMYLTVWVVIVLLQAWPSACVFARCVALVFALADVLHSMLALSSLAPSLKGGRDVRQSLYLVRMHSFSA